jgi:hypothetical protein
VADAQVRNDDEGFGRYFFHTHAKGEVCHLESVDLEGNQGTIVE